ncbi:YidC family membrane integrase SpoIIIJ [Priestia taiwanensis]|uniref:Membrane protein insertase YidC n=1 Tax=Priestia taiwanensis TaxID=1347902 RepID=A0A917AXJ3_9BACI|nr:YidC family membrane integrase SpoIIIJ [Priestia taiwanensis]MBM7364847.1 YidC/Oxa1 family membrane protein insertase [Priestia taiwanensis]GGE83206.1 membrane protein insertase YidC [Priestia taiwanensis]
MKKRLALLVTLMTVVFLVSGCTDVSTPITSESEGIWNEYFVYPLSWLITTIAESLGGLYGLSIVIVTLIVRFALLPLMIKQTKSTKAMQAINPEIQKLKEKYSSKDAATQQKLQQETMLLFQKNGVNPLAGCLPILVQMPIFIGFYHAIMRTTEISKHSFLWFDLGDKDPFYILPVIVVLTQYLSLKISMVGPAADNPQMKIMLYVMPILIFVFSLNVPSALTLYWVIGNVFTIFQTLLIKGPEIKEARGKSVGGKK